MSAYKKILAPTDGSLLSAEAARAAIELACQIDAEIVGIFVAPLYQYPIYVEVVPPNFPSEEEYRESMHKTGEIYLKAIQDTADVSGVKFTGITLFSDAIAAAIVDAAAEHQCDLIFMGSHGRSGWQRALLGSVAAKVLAMCHVPVLVYRAKN